MYFVLLLETLRTHQEVQLTHNLRSLSPLTLTLCVTYQSFVSIVQVSGTLCCGGIISNKH